MAWDFMKPTSDISLAYDLAAMVSTLDGSDWRDAIRLYMPDVGADLFDYVTRDHTAVAPRCIVIHVHQGTLILFQGVKREATALRLMQGYGEPFDLRRPAGINSQVRRAEEEIWNALFNFPGSLDNNILIAGHSFGGAVAQVLASDIRWVYPMKTVRVVTFGSPRVGIHQFVQEQSGIDHVRYWNDDDPIWQVAPHSSEAPAGHTLLRGPTSYRWNQFNHHGTGVSLQSTGWARRAEQNAGSSSSVETNLIGWATGILHAPVEAHSIHEYYLRLGRALDRGITFGPQPAGGTLRPRRPPNEPRSAPPLANPEIVAEVQRVQAAVVAVRAVTLPTVFTVENRQGVQVVVRGDEVVVIAANRTRARRIASFGNDLVRQGRALGLNNEDAIARTLAGMI